VHRKGVATATGANEEQIVRAAIAGDEAAFTQLVERYRGELQVHAYRMLGSLEDAQDALQEAFLRAWKARATYRRQSTFRAWLYRITTNACLRILERRPRRLVPYEIGPAAEVGAHPTPPADLPWLQPYPDRLIDESPEPDEAAVTRETIELAFLAAIQHLPPRQRAVLILRDALDWPADDTAGVLEMSLAAVNSALQRARATMQERLPAARLEWATAADAEDAERSLLHTYMEAFERHDDRRLVTLLREDVRLAMPPHPTWYEGLEAVAAFLARVAFRPGSEPHRFVPTRANRQPAFGVYRGEGADARPFAINVVEIEAGSVAAMHFFKYPELFPAFGLPNTLR
jgi:RNA polymerase sigma-70 factor, ECF subfamily